MSLIRRHPLSERELAARRSNAQRSTGPRTARGKARSRFNGLKHGGRSERMADFLKKHGMSLRDLYSLSRLIRLPGETSDPILAAVYKGWLRREGMESKISRDRAKMYGRTGEHL